MQVKQYIELFNQVATKFGFTNAFAGWYFETVECIVVIALQKSYYKNNYDLNIKFYFKGLFGTNLSIQKSMVTTEIGDVFIRPPNQYCYLFDISNELNVEKRFKELSDLFQEFLMPLVLKGSTCSGILKLAESGDVYLLPAVKTELLRRSN